MGRPQMLARLRISSWRTRLMLHLVLLSALCQNAGGRNPTKGAGGRWWQSMTEPCPISLQPIRRLRLEPFNLPADGKIDCWFDSQVLSRYLASPRGRFVHPTSRRPITRSECDALDRHLARLGLPRAHLTAAFDLWLRTTKLREDDDEDQERGGSPALPPVSGAVCIPPAYTPFAIEYARGNLEWVRRLEESIAAFAGDETEGSLVLPSSAARKRKIAHEVASHFGLCSEAHGPERDRYVVISRPPPPPPPRIPPRGVSVFAPPSRLRASEAAEASSNETEPSSANATTASPLLLTEACLPPDAPQASLAAFRARHSIELVTVDPRTKIEGFLSGMEGMYNIAWDGEGAAVISFASEQARKQGAELLGGGRRGKGGVLLFRVGHRRRDGVVDLGSSPSGTEAESNATIGTGRGGGEEGGDIVAWVKERIEAAGGLAGDESIVECLAGLRGDAARDLFIDVTGCRRYRAEAFAKALGEWTSSSTSKSSSSKDDSPAGARSGVGEERRGGGDCLDAWGGRRLGTSLSLPVSAALGELSLGSPGPEAGPNHDDNNDDLVVGRGVAGLTL